MMLHLFAVYSMTAYSFDTNVLASRFTSAPKSANRTASDDGSLDSPSSASGQPGSPSWSQLDAGNSNRHTQQACHGPHVEGVKVYVDCPW